MSNPSISLDKDLRSIWIPMVENKTLEYGAEESVTSALVDEMTRAPEIRVVRKSAATSILRAKINNYRISPVDLDSRDQEIGYDLNVGVEVWLEKPDGTIVVPPKEFSQAGVFYFSGNPTSLSESLVLRQLAISVRSYIVEGW